MADSDNTTTLPLVTHRRAVVGVASAIARSSRNVFASRDLKASQSDDLAEAVWRTWQDAHEETQRLCGEQQCLERKLIEAVGLPRATLQSSDGENVEADFEAHKARWDTADRELGYSATLRAERDAAQRAADLLEMLSRTPATSLAGVAAKLDAVLREGQPSEDDPEFPWPQIRSVLDDVVRIGQQTGQGAQA
ncbi:hypothetical protein EOA32_34900 [Mesorhizobium sp. M1A.F.Ca.ET.072.01.1.1]|uniref:hypothetical protein n=1 Tax=Mesorhizobium sp. M1A.F.Ca.ET.072.01.1.1 TaxID=2496753 RepID=UPI000FD38C3B|nr:hypothetical protein [Mesorhizobium sp. M1A.F.Ca.ET.072.01.1.1]RUW45143.1 hypothetical protein EOA32_34900 [Mesorhizobium sp. M1A.F.Ca.ET.072.01.1.1]TIV03866.1 MAG: hypothetical protein E5W04_06370 [Mesorhizobium sp.]